MTPTHRKRRRETTPDDRQRETLRSELHDHIDYIINQLPTIHRMSRDMAAGYSASTIGDGRGGNDGLTTVERLATQPQPDPAAWATDALAGWDDTITAIRRTNSRVHRLMPMTDADIEKARERQNDVPNCTLCNDPIPDKIRRIDGQPFHASSCYYRVFRAGRAS